MKTVGKNFKSIRNFGVVLATLSTFTPCAFAQENTVSTGIMDRAPVLISGTSAFAVADTLLDGIRGGFASAEGVLISFGIERVTYINGVLTTSTSFNLPPNMLSADVSGQHRLIPDNFSQIQRGASNVNTTHVSPEGFRGTFIQNSLDNQSIRATTTINAITNTSQVMKSLNFGATMRDALGAAIIGR